MKTLHICITLLALLWAPRLLHAQTSCLSLVWSDEFDYTGAPDPDKWDYDIGGNGWGNNELQYYTDRLSNAEVADGFLTITARKEPFSNRGYTSARLVSRQKGDWTYGRFEIRAKLPTGRGTWPAIWMLPTDWEYGGWPASGEIDIMEHVGYDEGRVHGTVHTEAYNHGIGTQRGGSTLVNDATSAFHTYVIEWTEDKIDWYIDGAKYYTFRNEDQTFAEWPFDKRFHLLLNIAVGGNWGGAEGVDETIWPQAMEVDYVRVYGFGVSPEITGDQYLDEGETEATFSVTEYSGDITYTWSVPETATITSGQGTSQITVQWGDAPGTVSVSLAGDTGCDVQETSIEVAIVEVPDSEPFSPLSFTAGVASVAESVAGTGNEITLTDEGEALRIDYTVTNVSQNPQVFIPFEKPLNLSEFAEFTVSMKAAASDQTLPVLFYLEDVYGVQTNASPFLVGSVPRDDAYAEYSFDYAERWLSNFPRTGAMVDSSKIAGVRVYVNEGTDTFWINGFALTRPEEGEEVTGFTEAWPVKWKTYPNPAATPEWWLEGLPANVTLRLHDLQGRSLPVQWERHGDRIHLRVPQATPGLYWLQVTGPNQHNYVQKLLLK